MCDAAVIQDDIGEETEWRMNFEVSEPEIQQCISESSEEERKHLYSLLIEMSANTPKEKTSRHPWNTRRDYIR